MDHVDIVAIGGGTAGLVTAAGAASLGLSAALIERDALGGDCLWTGCVPSKALLASARAAHTARTGGRLGLGDAPPPDDRAGVMARMREARATVAHHDDPERFRRMGVDVIMGEAVIERPDRVRVGERVLAPKHIVVATGASPVVPPIPGLADAEPLTHQTVFDLDALPPSVAVLGAGPIGCEFAQIFRRLGAEVTLFEMLPGILPQDEPEAAAVLADTMAAEGIVVETATTVERVEPGAAGRARVCARRPDGSEVIADVHRVFVATGRRAHTAGLGLEAAGVALDDGAVAVDATLKSTVPTIWAAGDVAGGLQFTHVAEYQAKLVLRNIIAPLRARARYDRVPRVTYTDPEVAQLGLTESEARARHGGDVAVYRYGFDDLDRAIVDGATSGFVKIVTGRRARIVGATIVGRGAGELLPVLSLAMETGTPLPRLSRLIYAYPTMAEGIKRTADSYYRQGLAGWKGNLVRRVVRWLV